MAETNTLTTVGDTTPWTDLGAGPGLKVFSAFVPKSAAASAFSVSFEVRRWLSSTVEDNAANASPILQADGATKQTMTAKGYMRGQVYGRVQVRAVLDSVTGGTVPMLILGATG